MGAARRRISWFALAAVGVAVLILLGGFFVGQLLSADESSGLIQPGTVVEVRVTSGSSVIGAYTGSADGFFIISTPASLDAAAAEPTLRALSAPPDSLGGNVLVGQDQVVMIGAVAQGSELESRYYEAVGADPAEPSRQPSP